MITLFSSSAKINKSNKHEPLYYSTVMYLSPADEYSIATGTRSKSMCPYATGCRDVCLITSGRMHMTPVVKARLKRTEMFLNQREKFFDQLFKEIEKHIDKSKRKALHPVVRLNGTSDVLWERELVGGKTVFEYFRDVIFYDYTKFPLKYRQIDIENYFLTYSYNERPSSKAEAIEYLDQHCPVAVVFRTRKPEEFPKTMWGYPVVDGDYSDARFKNYQEIIGLTAKGKAMRDASGFVVDVK